MITLCTLGQCRVMVGERAVTPDAGRMFACLLYLAVERGRAAERATLARLLWPALPSGRRRHALRQLLYRVRRLGVPLRMSDQGVELPAGAVARTFAAAPDLARLLAEGGGAACVGACLPGYVGPSADFDAWVEGYRAVTEAGVRRALRCALAELRRFGDWESLELHARVLLRLDPLDECAHLACAEAAAMRGDAADALAMLARYREDLGTASPRVDAAIAALRGRVGIPAGAGGRALLHAPPEPPREPLVGRETAYAALMAVLAGAERGAGAAVLLAGSAGIGKTRLVAELAASATLRGVATARVACADLSPRPLGVVAALAERVRELPGALGSDPEALALLARLGAGGHRDAGGFAADGRRPAPPTSRAPTLTAARVQAALGELLDAVTSEAPLLVVLDDAPAMDSASRRVLRALVDGIRTRPLCLLLLARPDGLPPLVAELGAAARIHELGPLDGDAPGRLLDTLAQRREVALTEGDRSWCLATGAGNPLALGALAEACAAGASRRGVPHAVRALVETRLAGLRPVARRVLEAAVLLGREATVRRVARVLELPTHVLAGALGELTRGGVLRERQAVLEAADGLVQAVVREALPPSVRQLLLHGRRPRVTAAWEGRSATGRRVSPR